MSARPPGDDVLAEETPAPAGVAGVDDLPAPDHAARRRRLRERLEDAQVGAVVVTGPANVAYLTGFRGSNGQLWLTAGSAVLITDGRYAEDAAEAAPDLDLRLERDWIDTVADLARQAGGPAVGFAGGQVSWRAGHRLSDALQQAGGRAVALDGPVEELRAVKDDAELARLRAACAITSAALTAMIDRLRPGLTERQVAARLERDLLERGAEDRAFDTIVAAGPNGARPHHDPTDRAIERGELVTIDCGARVDGYHADMTRTVAVGEPGGTLRGIHRTVEDAQAAGRGAVADGARGEDVDGAARQVVEEAGRGDGFVHGTGHGVGLQVHEAPVLAPSSDDNLAAGQTVTVEPGVYVPGTGGVRIEDTVVVGADGDAPEVLTEAPRELLVL